MSLARLRVECLRLGVTDVAVSVPKVGGPRRSVARISPLSLRASAEIRLRRLAPGAEYREGLQQLVVPLEQGVRTSEVLRDLLVALVPYPEEADPTPEVAAGSMRRAMKRLLALFAVVAVGITVAALTVPSTAATVNGQRISTTNLDNDLAAIDASPGYLCYLQASVLLDSGGQDQLPQLSGVAQPGSTSANGTYNSAFVRYWLSRLVSSQVVDQVTASRGITVSDAQLATARSETEQVIDGAFATLEQDGVQPSCSGVPTGSQVLGSLPTSFVDSLVRAQASSDLLAASVVGSNLTPVSMARYFAAHPSAFDTLCVNGFAVTSEASANQIRASVLAGTPFASAAPSGSSVQSACFAATSANYGAISQAVGKLPIGGVSQPLESSQGSYYLFELTKRTPTTLVWRSQRAAGDDR